MLYSTLAPSVEGSVRKAAGRVDAVDFARGAALIGMALYHLAWDLADFGFIAPAFPFSPPMRLFSHLVAGAFLALAGVSLALAHPVKIDWRAFWRRIAIVAGAAALVSAGSFWFARGQFIWFGILHCIAVSSVLAAPFILARASAILVAGLAATAAPFFVHSKMFDPPAFLWIGLGDALPNTLDWRPLLPWGGLLLLGLAAARFPGALTKLTSPARWRARGGLTAGLCIAGRHSLPIYLVHQPALVALVAALAHSGIIAVTQSSGPARPIAPARERPTRRPAPRSGVSLRLASESDGVRRWASRAAAKRRIGETSRSGVLRRPARARMSPWLKDA